MSTQPRTRAEIEAHAAKVIEYYKQFTFVVGAAQSRDNKLEKLREEWRNAQA